MRDMKIMVAIPCSGLPETLCMETLFGVAMRCRGWCALDVRFITGYSCEMARNEAARLFLESDADYLWFVDADMALPLDSLERLVAMDASIASGVCFRKMQEEDKLSAVCRIYIEGETVFYRESEIPENVFEASGVGAACLLIKRDVMEECAKESTGGRVFVYSHDPLISEDLWFCNLARALGYRIMIDGGLRIGHIGKVVF